jgi:hypothetical protein
MDWRFVLEDPHTSERISFATLAEMDAFLTNWMAEQTGKERDG